MGAKGANTLGAGCGVQRSDAPSTHMPPTIPPCIGGEANQEATGLCCALLLQLLEEFLATLKRHCNMFMLQWSGAWQGRGRSPCSAPPWHGASRLCVFPQTWTSAGMPLLFGMLYLSPTQWLKKFPCNIMYGITLLPYSMRGMSIPILQLGNWGLRREDLPRPVPNSAIIDVFSEVKLESHYQPVQKVKMNFFKKKLFDHFSEQLLRRQWAKANRFINTDGVF